MRTIANGIYLQEDEVVAALEMKTRVEYEMRVRNLEGITTEVSTDPDGSNFVKLLLHC